MTAVLRRPVDVVLALLLLTALACDPSDPCDPGDYEEHGLCREIPDEVVDAGMDASSDASSDEGDDGGSEPEEEPPTSDPYEGFGDGCADDGDCPNDLICGAPMLPSCTQVNCTEEPSICPPDWTCFDTTGVSPDPSVTSICLDL